MAEQNYDQHPDSRYLESSYHPQSKDDMIDFPCSPAWLNCYHDMGLTPRHEEEKPPAEQPDVLGLIGDVDKLRKECGSLRKEINRLKMPKEDKEKTTFPGRKFKPIQPEG